MRSALIPDELTGSRTISLEGHLVIMHLLNQQYRSSEYAGDTFRHWNKASYNQHWKHYVYIIVDDLGNCYLLNSPADCTALQQHTVLFCTQSTGGHIREVFVRCFIINYI
jgi:hypothetical protein